MKYAPVRLTKPNEKSIRYSLGALILRSGFKVVVALEGTECALDFLGGAYFGGKADRFDDHTIVIPKPKIPLSFPRVKE